MRVYEDIKTGLEQAIAHEKNKVGETEMNEMWIEINDGVAPDGFPKHRYKHNSCESVGKAYPYCPYCGKKITHMKTVDKDFNWYWESKGFICV